MKVRGGFCSSNGHNTIHTAWECRLAAQALGLDDIVPTDLSHKPAGDMATGHAMPGCTYFEDGHSTDTGKHLFQNGYNADGRTRWYGDTGRTDCYASAPCNDGNAFGICRRSSAVAPTQPSNPGYKFVESDDENCRRISTWSECKAANDELDEIGYEAGSVSGKGTVCGQRNPYGCVTLSGCRGTPTFLVLFSGGYTHANQGASPRHCSSTAQCLCYDYVSAIDSEDCVATTSSPSMAVVCKAAGGADALTRAQRKAACNALPDCAWTGP